MTIGRANYGAASNGGSGLMQLAYSVCSAVTWMAALNLAWMLGTALGGVLLGAGPATAAAHTLARRRLRGEGVRFVRDFASEYRAQWRTANLAFAPLVLVAISLAFTGAYLVESHAAWPAIAAYVVVAALAVGAGGVMAPMYAHYELPWCRYTSMSLRFALAMPWAWVLVLALAAAVVLVTLIVPALFWFVSIGAWIYLDTALCLTLFAANDARLNDDETDAPA